eukprot:1186974-Prorocentrum_minimum.AAC.1
MGTALDTGRPNFWKSEGGWSNHRDSPSGNRRRWAMSEADPRLFAGSLCPPSWPPTTAPPAWKCAYGSVGK